MSPTEASETARQREVFKYYQPTVHLKPGEHAPPPQSSHNTTLTAFAQLGALRLNARRGIISLISRDHQHIIAEATRTLSLRNDAVYQQDDALWKGEVVLPRRDGPCSVAIDTFTGVLDGNRDYFLVPDLSEDERFCSMGPVTGPPFMKFYIAAPLISPRGLVLGAFCVTDENPRQDTLEHHIEFMKDMSSTIMDHLEANRIKQQHKRAERMIRGLGLYVEGKSSLREWWLNTGQKPEEAAVNAHVQRGESLVQQANQRRNDTNSAATSVTTADLPDTSFAEGQGASSLAIGQHSPPSGTEQTCEASKDLRRNSSNSTDETSGTLLQEANLFSELKETFARASNLIRECIGVEGAVFLDASVGTFGGSSTRTALGLKGPPARNHKITPLATSSSDEAHNVDGTLNQTPLQLTAPKMCGVLGYSTYDRSSLSKDPSTDLNLDMAESFLRRLLRRYPHGKIFNFDDEGSLSSSEDEFRKPVSNSAASSTENTSSTDDASQRPKKSKEADGKAILKLLPGARCVAFFPLWDAHRERWFAGSLVWTSDPTSVLDLDEYLTYLASFGNNIMAEVSRLNALVSSQVKNSFVSSISHELRSPLHGVLASVEFIQDTPMTDLQEEMINMIESCGKTLLDTIDHVLDFTKLKGTYIDKRHENTKSTPQKIAQGRTSSPKIQLLRQTPAVDLSVLTEEVLTGIYCGRGFDRNSLLQRKDGSRPPGSHSSTKTSVVPMIIVNINWRVSWRFHIDPGAWRRLVMNIFGNALKYTETGFIRVSLESSDSRDTSKESSSSIVRLTVTDSGKGMSEDFLRHHIYTPFAQEDSLSEGTGLGLSIVRQIVDELDGSIEINSERQSGTEVRISLPLISAKLSLPDEDKPDIKIQCQEQVRGMKAHLVGFDISPNSSEETTGALSVEAKRMNSLKESLSSLLGDWFGMNVSQTTSVDLSSEITYFLTESSFSNLLAAGGLESDSTIRHDRKSLFVVICTKNYRSRSPINFDGYDIVFMQQPIGPQKLAVVLWRHPVSIRSPRDKLSTELLPPDRPKKSWEEVSDRESLAAVPLLSNNPAAQQKFSSAELTDSPQISVEVPLPPSSYVLLVEDNAINLKLLATYMEKLGVDYATAENGVVAVQRYLEAVRPFNLILMDISMPVMNGLEASRRIRVLEREMNRERVHLIALTGAASESSRQEAFSAGIDQFLTKPVPLKMLKELLEEYTGDKR